MGILLFFGLFPFFPMMFCSIVKDTLDNRLVAQKLGLAVDSLKEGGGMSAPLMEAEIFRFIEKSMKNIRTYNPGKLKSKDKTNKIPLMNGLASASK